MNPAKVFLEALFSGKPDELYLLLWTLPEKESRWFREIDDAVRYAESLQAHDLYVGVGLAGQDYGSKQRCKSDEIAGVIGFWADLDLKSDAHPKSLPSSIEEALTILPAELTPTFIIVTGNGVHVWWLFNTPWIFESDNDRREAAILVSRLQTLLRYNSNQHGWAFERLSDLARVLRIPGTVNRKDPNAPKPVTIYASSDRHYNPSDFTEYLDDLSIADPETEERDAKEWAERFVDKPLVVNPEAAISDDMLARWMQADMRFRNTWNRQRHDLNDQSQSGYDLALACFGFDAGLNEQQIVELIIQNRRIHGERRPKSLDYYQRTISKAAKRTGSPGLPVAGTPAGTAAAPGMQLPAVNSISPETDPKPTCLADNLTEKAKLCDQISRALGIPILRLIKVTGKEPVYFMDVEKGRIEFPSVGKLISQEFVSLAGSSEKSVGEFRFGQLAK